MSVAENGWVGLLAWFLTIEAEGWASWLPKLFWLVLLGGGTRYYIQ